MTKSHLKILWFILSLIPTAFLFHFFEYEQYIQGASLFLTSLLFVLITGFLSSLVKIRYIILVNTLVAILSMLLASKFIFDDGSWFKPIGLDITIVLTAILFLTGQLVVWSFSKRVFSYQKLI